MESNIREELHAKILHILMDDKIFEDEANLYKFEDANNYLKAGYIRSADEPMVSLCFNLPVLGTKLFITVSDGLPDKVTFIMSQLEEITSKNSNINTYHVIRFDDDYFKKKGRDGVLLLPIAVSPALNHVPRKIEYKGIVIEPILVVFLSSEEYNFWKRFGNDKLMDKFSKDNKDLISMEVNKDKLRLKDN